MLSNCFTLSTVFDVYAILQLLTNQLDDVTATYLGVYVSHGLIYNESVVDLFSEGSHVIVGNLLKLIASVSITQLFSLLGPHFEIA